MNLQICSTVHGILDVHFDSDVKNFASACAVRMCKLKAKENAYEQWNHRTSHVSKSTLQLQTVFNLHTQTETLAC
jgi:hypothetical protein